MYRIFGRARLSQAPLMMVCRFQLPRLALPRTPSVQWPAVSQGHLDRLPQGVTLSRLFTTIQHSSSSYQRVPFERVADVLFRAHARARAARRPDAYHRLSIHCLPLYIYQYNSREGCSLSSELTGEPLNKVRIV